MHGHREQAGEGFQRGKTWTQVCGLQRPLSSSTSPASYPGPRSSQGSGCAEGPREQEPVWQPAAQLAGTTPLPPVLYPQGLSTGKGGHVACFGQWNGGKSDTGHSPRAGGPQRKVLSKSRDLGLDQQSLTGSKRPRGTAHAARGSRNRVGTQWVFPLQHERAAPSGPAL